MTFHAAPTGVSAVAYGRTWDMRGLREAIFVPGWDEAADWYAGMLTDSSRGYNQLAARVALDLLGDVHGRDVLDLGCGEGHISRLLARAGAKVTGVDPTARLLQLAEQAERQQPLGIRYQRGNAEHLAGLQDQSVDAVCAVLVLHHTDPLEAALTEAYRVLRRGGTLVLIIPHPVLDHPNAGWAGQQRILGQYAEERFWSTATGGQVSAVHHIGWHHRTLSSWLNALADAGFRVQRAAEPLGRDAKRPDHGGAWRDLPRFLAIRCST
jgi:ubiquinone/menaquinone biosynthesis C-methylase UbiE